MISRTSFTQEDHHAAGDVRTERRVLRRSRRAHSEPTRAKLLEAAGEVFADVGYHAATIREICARAGANNGAAVNYHFGDKLELYTEVLQQSLRAAHIEAIQSALNQDAPPEEVLRAVIRARLRSVCRGELPDWHFRIMVHELAHPTPALTGVINTVLRPTYRRMLELVGGMIGLAPEHERTRLCAHSIMGQILHYVIAGPVLMRIWPELKMTPEQVDKIANHIAEFSLSYLRALSLKPRASSLPKRARRSR